MKTIKIFDGIKVTTDDDVRKYPDMTAFDTAVRCTDEQRSDIIRSLLMCGGTVDLSEFTSPRQRLILDLYKD